MVIKLPSISIVVLTWNQCELTLACLASLTKLEYPAEKLTIILVDNNSGDETVASVQLGYPQVKIIENSTNLGFAEGNNVGMQEALKFRPDNILLLNNDTIVDNMMLANLIDCMEREVDCGIVGPKMLYYEPSNVIWAAGNRIHWMTAESIRLQAEQLDDKLHEDPEEVDFITACGLLLKREVLDEIGLLDPRFFIYYEETDWCMRARKAGWRIIYEPRAKLWHKISAAMGSSSPATDYYMTRNSFLFLAKNQRGAKRMVSLIYLTIRTLLTILAYTLKSHNGERIRNRDSKLLGLRDAILRRWGRMGADVEHVCYPAN